MRQAMTWEVAAPALGIREGGARQKAILGGGAGLVPLLAATGLALPLPAQIYRLAESVIERTAAIAEALPWIERDAPTAHHARGVAPAGLARATPRIASAGRVHSSRAVTRRIGGSHAQAPHVGRTGIPASTISVPTRSRAPDEPATTPVPTRSTSRGDARTTKPSTQTATSVPPAAGSNADAAPAQSEAVTTAPRDPPAPTPVPAPKDPPAPSPEPSDKPATLSASATVSAPASPSPVTPTSGGTASASLTVSADPVSTTVTVGIGLKR
jgi:hypothetical protein